MDAQTIGVSHWNCSKIKKSLFSHHYFSFFYPHYIYELPRQLADALIFAQSIPFSSIKPHTPSFLSENFHPFDNSLIISLFHLHFFLPWLFFIPLWVLLNLLNHISRIAGRIPFFIIVFSVFPGLSFYCIPSQSFDVAL